MRSPIAPHPQQHLMLSVFWSLAILVGVWWYLIFILICISLMIYDVEHLFICLFATCIYLFFHIKKIFIYLCILFLAALDLRCCVQAFSSCGERGLLFVVVCRLLIAVASLAAEHRL